MSIGQEGDTRKFRQLRSSDHYELKDAVQSEKLNPHSFRRCKICGQQITGQDYDGYDLKCRDEPL